jgi:WD40 repeat protein
MVIDRAHGFASSRALVVGIAQYRDGFRALRNAAADARAVGERLVAQGYDVTTLLDESATATAILAQFATLETRALENERVVFYFAGHGVALNGDVGPEGYLIPANAHLARVDTYLQMRAIHDRLLALPCRHLLAILDCCFAGSFRWSSSRDVAQPVATLYRQQYDRFVRDRAWQVLTSAGSDENALDFSIDRRGATEHSPFAQKLLDALDGTTDRLRGELITATKLYVYLRDAIEEPTRQTPGIFPLGKHDKGEYIFQPPSLDLELPPAPELTPANNPFQGLASFDESREKLFFGRDDEIAKLVTVVDNAPLAIVVAASGAGKSSLVQAGLLPRCRSRAWQISPIVRPGERPVAALEQALAAVPGSTARLLIVVDQLEELATMCRDDQQRREFLARLAKLGASEPDRYRVVATLRADFEPFVRERLPDTPWTRVPLARLRPDELRKVIECPAATKAVFFEPGLVDEMLNAVDGQPEVLPLLSHVLAELYNECAAADEPSRTLMRAVYDHFGGVAGSIAKAARSVYERLVADEPLAAATARNVILRMIDSGPGALARRRVRRDELVYSDDEENARVDRLLARFVDARLVSVSSQDNVAYAEPVHDALLQRWVQVDQWLEQIKPVRQLQADLALAARAWSRDNRARGLLWTADPRLDSILPHLDRPQGWLNRTETEFVRQSVALRKARRRRTSAIVGAVGALLATAATVAWIQRGHARDEAEHARQSAREAENRTLLETARLASLLAHQSGGGCAARLHALAAALPHVERRESLPAPIIQGLIDSIDSELCPRVLRTGSGIDDLEGASIVFSPDGKQVLTVVQASGHSVASVLDVAAGRELQTFPHAGLVIPDGVHVVSRMDNGDAQIWEAATHTSVAILSTHPVGVAELVISPAGNRVATWLNDGRVQIWRLDGAELMATLPGTSATPPIFSPRGEFLITTTFEGAASIAHVWDALAGPSFGSVKLGDDVTARAVTADGYAVTALVGPRVMRIALGRGERDWIAIDLENKALHLYDATLDGRRFAVSAGGDIAIWGLWPHRRLIDLHHGEANASRYNAPGHLNVRLFTTEELKFSPRGSKLLMRDAHQVEVWDTTTGEQLATFPSSDDHGPIDVAWSPDERQIAAISSDGAVLVWQLPVRRRFSTGPESPYAAVTAPDGARIVTVDRAKLSERSFLPAPHAFPSGSHRFVSYGAGVIFVSDAASRRPIRAVGRHSGDYAAVLSADGRYLVVTGEAADIATILDLETSQPVRTLQWSDAGQSAMGFSRDGTSLITTGGDQVVRIWSVHGQQDPVTIDVSTDQAREGVVHHAALAPDGQHVLTAGSDGIARIWDVASKTVVTRLPHGGIVYSAAFSSDGSRIVTAGSGGVAIWSADGTRIATLASGVDVRLAEFTPDGAYVVIGPDMTVPASEQLDLTNERVTDDRARLIPVGDAALLDAACREVDGVTSTGGLTGGQLAAIHQDCTRRLANADNEAMAGARRAEAVDQLQIASWKLGVDHVGALEAGIVALALFSAAGDARGKTTATWVVAVATALGHDLAKARARLGAEAAASDQSMLVDLATFAEEEMFRPDVARALLEGAATFAGDDPRMAEFRAEVLLAEGQYKQCLTESSALLGGTPDGPTRVVMLAFKWAAKVELFNRVDLQIAQELLAAYRALIGRILATFFVEKPCGRNRTEPLWRVAGSPSCR